MTAPHLPEGQAVAGKYTVRSLLAYTGATASYHATDAQGGQVVLKLLDPAIGQRADVMGALDRVARETAALSQSSVLPILDAGYDVATGAPFRTTEYLNIPSLARLVDNGPLSEEVTAAIVRGAAFALDAAHARGLFHHALKPTDLFVGPAPHYPVLVADFGSRVIQDAIPTHEVYVQSAPWLAPEQLYPGASVGAQADVYSLALLAFYALTGRSYWWACQASPLDVQAWQQEMLAQHVAVSRRAGELGRPIAPSHDGLFARALSTNPADRPATAGEFAQAFAQGGGALVAAAQSAPTQVAASPAAVPPQPSGYPAAQAAPPHGYPQPPAAAAHVGAPGATVAMDAMVPGGPGMYGFDAGPPAASPAVSAAPPAAAGAAPMASGLPTFAEPAPRKKPAGMVPVLIGIVAALLIGVVVVTFLFLRSRGGETDETSADATTDPSATSASGGSAPSSSSEPGSGGAGGAKDGGSSSEQTVAVSFVCIPPCDKIVLDGEEVADPSKPVELLPGKHTVEASKGGYATRKESFEVELGGPVEKKFVMVPTSASPPPKKKCGKFLKRCD